MELSLKVRPLVPPEIPDSMNGSMLVRLELSLIR